MNKYVNNPTPTPSRRWRLAVVALVLSAIAIAAPLLTTVAYACQGAPGGC